MLFNKTPVSSNVISISKSSQQQKLANKEWHGCFLQNNVFYHISSYVLSFGGQSRYLIIHFNKRTASILIYRLLKEPWWFLRVLQLFFFLLLLQFGVVSNNTIKYKMHLCESNLICHLKSELSVMDNEYWKFKY